MNSSSTKQVAVIGAGIAGLLAAYQLGKAGARVTVFEKDHVAGGRAKTINKDGFELNLGPHALYQAGELHQFLVEHNLLPAGAAPQIQGGIALVDGKAATLPQSLTNILFSDYLSLQERAEVATIFGGITKIDFASIMSITFAEWLDRHVKTTRARETIEAFVRLSTYSNSPQKMSAGAALRQVARAFSGVLYLDHGWQYRRELAQRAACQRVFPHWSWRRISA